MAGARDLGFGSSFAGADTDNAKLLRFKSGQPGSSERPSRDSGSIRHAAAPQGPPGPNSAKVHCLCTQCPAPGGLLGQVQPRGRAPVSLTNSMCSGHPHLPGKDGHAQTRHPRAPPRTGPEHRAGPRPAAPHPPRGACGPPAGRACAVATRARGRRLLSQVLAGARVSRVSDQGLTTTLGAAGGVSLGESVSFTHPRSQVP